VKFVAQKQRVHAILIYTMRFVLFAVKNAIIAENGGEKANVVVSI